MGCGASAVKPPVEGGPASAVETVKVNKHELGAGPAKSSPKNSAEPIQAESSPKKVEPLPVLADGAKRPVIAESLYKLNPVWADKLLAGDSSLSLPEQANQIVAWRKAKFELWEEEDGLHLNLISKAASDKKKIVSWCGEPFNNLEVLSIDEVLIEGEQKQKSKHVKGKGQSEEDLEAEQEDEAVKVEVIEIAEEHKADLEALYPFVIRWDLAGKTAKKKCFVIGCEDESSCLKWIANLKIYANIGSRHAGAVMWKLNQSFYTDLPSHWRDDPNAIKDFGNLLNWRRRVCFLEQLKSHKALCITYVSEKSDAEECVANVLASVSDGIVKSVASVKKLPPIVVCKLDAVKTEKVKYSVQQYDIAVANSSSESNELELPTVLHAFQVIQSDDSDIGQASNIFAFVDPEMCDRWLAAIETVCKTLTKDTDLPALRVVG